MGALFLFNTIVAMTEMTDFFGQSGGAVDNWLITFSESLQ